MKKSMFTAIENVLDIYDPNRWWYYIPGFNGYEVSNDGYVRSMKHYIKYPYGIMITPVKRKPYGDSCDPLFELSDDNNVRRRVRLSQLMNLAFTSKFAVQGYPRATIITDSSSRNAFVKNKDGVYCKVYNGPHPGGGKNSKSIPPLDKEAKYSLLTILQSGKEKPFMEYSKPEVTVPIKSITGDEYYGRKDSRTCCYIDV